MLFCAADVMMTNYSQLVKPTNTYGITAAGDSPDLYSAASTQTNNHHLTVLPNAR
jgi:hypothetical protein